jgi:cytochrome P450
MLCIVDTGVADIASDQMMPDSDPPLHSRLRTPVARALSSRAIEKQEPQIRRIVDALLAPAREEENFDFAAAAVMFPMAFTGALMGLPEEDFPSLARLTRMTIAYTDPEFTQDPPRLTLRRAHHELFSAFAEEIARRPRSDPGDDLIGVLMSMTVDGKKLTDTEVIFNCYSLLLGANVTTPTAATAAVLALAERPDEFRRWRADPGLLDSGVEEALRWSSPANHFMRYAVRDVKLRGRQIAAGDAVSAWIGSANRDEDVFDDPFRFDVARQPNRHIAFGFGPHYCVGAPLARFALRILFQELLASFERVELAGPVEHVVSNWVAGIKHMPVRMKPSVATHRRVMSPITVGGKSS